jgi:uncharacterized membrane protein
MAESRGVQVVVFLTYLVMVMMVTTSITAGHTTTSRGTWTHPSTAYTGIAACALILGLCLGVSGLIMTITNLNNANIAPPEEITDSESSSPIMDILGPVFLGVGVASLIAGVSMCMYARYPLRRRLRTGQRAPGCEDHLKDGDHHT